MYILYDSTKLTTEEGFVTRDDITLCLAINFIPSRLKHEQGISIINEYKQHAKTYNFKAGGGRTTYDWSDRNGQI